MQINLRTLLLALPLLAAACSDAPGSDAKPHARTISVTVGSGPDIGIETQAGTRSSIGTDGETIRWNGNDTIALWAVNTETGMAALTAHPFAMFHYNATFNSAKFTADIPEMATGTYDYYAVAPRPSSVTGTLASFDLPAVQKFRTAELGGEYTSLPYDVMVAAPVQGPALAEGDNSDVVDLAFKHKVHLLKVVVQSNNLGEKVSEMVLTFPQPVVGQLTVDAADPDAAPVLENGSNKLTLLFDNPVEPGTTVFAAIAPIDLTNEEFSIVAFGETGESQIRALPGKNFAVGHTTPIIYNIPSLGRLFTRLTFSPAKDDKGKAINHLGESVEKITLKAPAGATFDNGLNVRTFTLDTEGKYTLVLKPSWQDKLSGQTVTAEFESEHAVVSGAISMPAIAAYDQNDAYFEVPYLFQENFDLLADKIENNDAWKSDRFSDTSASNLTALPGWTGTCVGGAIGECIRVASHCIHGLFTVYSRCPGRADSRPISTVKEGKSVKVEVSYTYCGDRFEGTGSGGSILVSAGYTTQSGPISSDNSIQNTTIAEAAINVDGPHDNNACYYLSGTHTQTYTIPDCTAATRLSWRVNNNRKSTGNGTYWLYVDNITVKIIE